jgi:hypothetical protein
MKISNLTLFLLFASITLVAQKEDLTRDTAFFKAQGLEYQRWLVHTGMGNSLQVRIVEVEPQQVALYLQFPTTNADSARAYWGRVKQDYARLNTGLTLEQALFYKMVYMMELRQSYANVQLYDTYDTRVEPCFYRGIYMKDGHLVVDSSGCKSKPADVYLSPGDLPGLKKPSLSEFRRKYTQEYVFDRVYEYAKTRYEQQVCVNRYPKVGSPQIDGNVMRFEVIDLCREVLKDAKNDPICKFINDRGFPCNWTIREKLTFTFVYKVQDGGFWLKCDIEGKVGSGFHDEVGRSGYLNMEIDFDGYLEDYATRFQNDLRNALR